MHLPTFDNELTQKIDDEFISKTVNLADFDKLILYFYPKDNTQGCTIQAIDFSHHQSDFAKLGYTIIGVSKDVIKSHQNFINKHNLSIALISDKEEKLCQHLGVIQQKKLYGKTYMGIVRSTFVFHQGQLIKHYPNVKAKNHAAALLDDLRNLHTQ